MHSSLQVMSFLNENGPNGPTWDKFYKYEIIEKFTKIQF